MQQGPCWTFDIVVDRLAEAGGTLMRLRVAGTLPAQFRSSMPEYVPDLYEGGVRDVEAELRPPPPTPREVTRMDQALSWTTIIPADMVAHRKVVWTRAMTSWRTGRPMHSWRQIGDMFGCNHQTAKNWHDLAIRILVVRLNRPGLCEVTGGPVGPSRRITNAQWNRAMRTLEARILAPV